MSGTVPDTGVPENAATGADEPEMTVMYAVFVSVLLPTEFVAVRVMVYVPTVVYR